MAAKVPDWGCWWVEKWAPANRPSDSSTWRGERTVEENHRAAVAWNGGQRRIVKMIIDKFKDRASISELCSWVSFAPSNYYYKSRTGKWFWNRSSNQAFASTMWSTYSALLIWNTASKVLKYVRIYPHHYPRGKRIHWSLSQHPAKRSHHKAWI